mmetsp:Transcript_6323/g.17476  ORF Transcript_6323/g.17476 Transcript_6323/m.17476 type:complete len:244 (-) Transcript_6323:26-757(-)
MMDALEERVEASFGSLGRSPVAGTQTQDGGGATGDRETSGIWRLDKNPCFRSSSQPLEADTSAAEEAAERIRRACGPSSSEESEEGEESDGGDVERQSEKADPDYDESVGVRASFAFCSQIDREAERDEADVASLQFDFEAGATMNPASAPWGPVSMDPTAASLRSALKGGRGREVLAQRQVSFDLPPLPKPWLPPHKRGVIAPESDGAEAKTGTDTVPDYVKHPDRYVKYEFDEPAVMGGST